VPTHKLPRVAHAQKPRPDERIYKRGGADLQNGWLARHGTLSLTDDRLVFVPTPLDTALRAKRREIPLDRLIEVERVPLAEGDMIPGGQRPRLHFHTEECVYSIMTGDIDAWLDAIEVVYDRRAAAGKPYRAKISRKTTSIYQLGREPVPPSGDGTG
jgi:hypothetical protein